MGDHHRKRRAQRERHPTRARQAAHLRQEPRQGNSPEWPRPRSRAARKRRHRERSAGSRRAHPRPAYAFLLAHMEQRPGFPDAHRRVSFLGGCSALRGFDQRAGSRGAGHAAARATWKSFCAPAIPGKSALSFNSIYVDRKRRLAVPRRRFSLAGMNWVTRPAERTCPAASGSHRGSRPESVSTAREMPASRYPARVAASAGAPNALIESVE